MFSFSRHKILTLLGAVCLISTVGGCATPPPDDDLEAIEEFQQLNDPLEPMNRVFFTVNDGLDTMFLRPISGIYRDVTPDFAQDRVSDFLVNLKSPVILLNDVLQGNISLAGDTIARFLLNSTFGVLGIMDVATPMGIPGHSADFGQTLGVWGVEEGPYLVLPVFGPSNPRDTVGLAADIFSDPLYWYLRHEDLEGLLYARDGLSAVSMRARRFEFVDSLKNDSLDYYATVRALYRQLRAEDVRAGLQGDGKAAGSPLPQERLGN